MSNPFFDYFRASISRVRGSPRLGTGEQRTLKDFNRVVDELHFAVVLERAGRGSQNVFDDRAIAGDRHRRDPGATPGVVIGNFGDADGVQLAEVIQRLGEDAPLVLE